MKHVVESGMYFGDYPEDAFFSIENSSLHQSVGEGIKTVEFILLHRDKNLFFVEAKSSCPNAANKDESVTKQENFEKYYKEITEKFCDSLQMYLSAVTGKIWKIWGAKVVVLNHAMAMEYGLVKK